MNGDALRASPKTYVSLNWSRDNNRIVWKLNAALNIVFIHKGSMNKQLFLIGRTLIDLGVDI